MKKRKAKRGRKAQARPRTLDPAAKAAREQAKLAARTARQAAHSKQAEALSAQAWRLANRFGYICDVEPAHVFAPTDGPGRPSARASSDAAAQERVETVRHLVAHVLLEIDRARPTDLRVAMRRDRQTLRNSFKRAWDLRDDEAVERLVLFVSETRKARFKDFRRATKRSRLAFETALSPTGRGGRHRPEDFRHALKAAAHALVHEAVPAPIAVPALGQTLTLTPNQAPKETAPALPPAAAILEASPLTRRLLRDPSISAEPTMSGGLRLAVQGYALKGGMTEVSAQLAKLLEAAGFTVTQDGVFGVPGKKSYRATLRVAGGV